jgi:uncharacterized repeat protein (TIGR03843 family)
VGSGDGGQGVTTARTVAGLPEEHVCAVLAGGVVELRGRIPEASNATLLAQVTLDGVTLACVYKPVRGERPLWDFPSETLSRREVAAFELSRWAGLDVVPPTVFREGPLGEGSVQVWIGPGELDEDGDPVPVEGGAGLVDLFRPARVPPGWLPVLSGEDGAGRPVVLAHADDAGLRAMAVFDAIANNADRKAGHVLRDVGGGVLGVDHGLTFHEEHKLRTVLWGFADQPLGPELLEATEKVALQLTPSEPLHARLRGLLAADEIEITARRARRLFRLGVLPAPRAGYPTVPWPLF